MSGCESCDERIKQMAQHPPEAGVPTTDACPDCGAVLAFIDARQAGRPLARDAQGRIGEVMGISQPGSALVSLRPVGGGVEWDVPAGSITLVGPDGEPLPTEAAP